MREPGLHTLTYDDLMRALRVSRPSLTAWMRGVDVPILTDEDRRHHIRLADAVYFLRRPGGRLRGLEGAELDALVRLDRARRLEMMPPRAAVSFDNPPPLRDVLLRQEAVRADAVADAARRSCVAQLWGNVNAVTRADVDNIIFQPGVLRWILTASAEELPHPDAFDSFFAAYAAVNIPTSAHLFNLEAA